MNTIATLTTAAICWLAGSMAYELCYTVTTFGGHLPFLLLTVGPALGFALAKLPTVD